MNSAIIPSFRLSYKEDETEGTVEPLHIEPIEERSSLHNWRIKPHRHQEVFHLFILSSGHVEATIDGQKHSVTAPQGILIPAQSVHEFEFQADTKGFVISTFNYEISNALADIPSIAPIFQHPIILRGEDSPTTSSLIHSFAEEFHNEYRANKVGRLTYIRALLKMMLIQISREQTEANSLSIGGTVSEESQFAKLTTFINTHYREHKSNEFYANRLSISASQLARLTNAVVGQSPHKLISNKILLEAKRYLIYTTMSLEQITDAVGIKDPGYFSRFFKKQTGVTPGQFRKDPTSALN